MTNCSAHTTIDACNNEDGCYYDTFKTKCVCQKGYGGPGYGAVGEVICTKCTGNEYNEYTGTSACKKCEGDP